MKKRFFDTEAWKLIRTALELGAMVLAILAVIWFMREVGIAEAEDVFPEDDGQDVLYVICTKDDYVNIRLKPGRKGRACGYLEPGDAVHTDGKRKNGYVHCVNLHTEAGDGWIHSGYLVEDRPEYVDADYTVVSRGRLAARKYVGGKRVRWLKPIETVHVYYMSDEWAVTNRGYVKSNYLEREGE